MSASVCSLEESRRLQDAALASLGLYRYKVPEDGNCMFRAVASQLQLDQDHYHKVLREAAASWIQQHVRDLLAAGLLESMGEVQDTATEGKWCGQAALVALANVLRVNIAVVQGGDQGAIDIQHVTPFDGVTSKEHPGILLAYLYNGHYDGVVHEPNVSNPDYAVWSAKCHFQDAVSEKVAHRLNDVTRTPPALRALLQSKDVTSSDSNVPKVSCMKIDLQPANHGSVAQDSQVKVSSLRSYDRQRRPSVDNVQEAIAVSQSPRHTVFRPSKSEMHTPSTRRAHSEAPDVRQRRSSSPGPTRQSPYTSIRAAVEKHRRRSSSRESPLDLPYNYDGSIRMFGGEHKPGSLKEPGGFSPQKQYNKENLRKTPSIENNGHVENSASPLKNVQLKSSGRRIIRQRGEEEEYMAPRHLPPKQLSLYKDFGTDTELPRQEIRRSSEGANEKKTSVPAAYQRNKPSFGVDFSSKKGKIGPAHKPKSSNAENGFHVKRESIDSASKVPPKVPPKVLPKPSVTQGDSKKITVLPIRMSSIKTADKQQQLPSQPLQNGYNNQRTVKVRSVSQQEMSKATQQQQQPLNRASSSPGERLSENAQRSSGNAQRSTENSQRSSGNAGIKSRQQLSQEATEKQYQRMRSHPEGKQEPRSRTRSRTNGTSDHPPPPRTRVRTRESKDGFEGYHKERVRSRERRRSTDPHHRKIADTAHELSQQIHIDTADIVTTPTEPLEAKKKQHMPYVGLSPSESRKVNVQVSTEDRNEICESKSEQIVLQSPQMVRDASTGSSNCTVKSSVGSLTSIPLSPTSSSPSHGSFLACKAPHLSPGPYSPGPTSVPSSPSPGISRVIQIAHSSNKDVHEIPLRSNPDQPTAPRRRSVVEIQPQTLQTVQPSVPAGRGVAKVPTIHLKSGAADSRGRNGQKSRARMFFS